MTDGKRNLSPMQFGLLGLFSLTFVAAIAAAIFRLPYSLHIKMILLITLWGIFQIAVMSMSGHGPTRHVRMAVMSAVGSLIQFIPLYAEMLFGKGPLWRHIFPAVLVMGVIVMHAAVVIWTVRKALKPEIAQE